MISESALSEPDYLKIIEIINELQLCDTTEKLDDLVRDVIAPTFNIQQLQFVWTDLDFTDKSANKITASYGFGISKRESQIGEQATPYFKSIVQTAITSQRPVLAHDVDIPQDQTEAEVQEFLSIHPEIYNEILQSETILRNSKNRRYLLLLNPPELSTCINLTRHYPNDTPFTLREVRMAELLRPSFLHCLKFISLNEELKNYQSLSEELSRVDTAMAMINPQGFIVFGNPAFQNLMELQQGDILPEDMLELIKQRDDVYSPTENLSQNAPDLTFYRHQKEVYRLSWTRLKRPGKPEDRCWLLRMKPAVEPFSQSSLAMQDADLSPREIEITTLICDGFSNEDISARLFISEHTVKNHIKNIFKKFGINKRLQLMNLLKPVEVQQ